MIRFLSLFTLLLFLGCSRPSPLQTITITHRNGITETITSPKRASKYQKIDFSQPQVFSEVFYQNKPEAGHQTGEILRYHSNGQLKQSLQTVDGRAYGCYREYHANGKLKLEAFVVDGAPSFDSEQQTLWVFEGACKAWNDQGALVASLNYSEGLLEGDAIYNDPSTGAPQYASHYKAGLLDGKHIEFFSDGSVYKEASYKNGLLNGPSVSYTLSPRHPLAEEFFAKGKLQYASYYTPSSEEPTVTLKHGNGKRHLYHLDTLTEIQEYQDGEPEGKVLVFGENGAVSRSFHQHKGVKQGVETYYYSYPASPRLEIYWETDEINGSVKSWYRSGQLERSCEMLHNTKNGWSSAWYENGALMLVEYYVNGSLEEGSYYQINSTQPISQIKGGEGTATLHTKTGSLLKKIPYSNHLPHEIY